MRSRFLTVAFLSAAALLVACDGGVPDVRDFGLAVPSLNPIGGASIRRIPSIDAKSLEDGSESSGPCTQWVTEVDTYNRFSGDFERLERCVSGGEIETIHTVGEMDLDDSGHYTTTYLYRDGHQVIWQFSYQPDPEAPNTTVYTGASDAGDSFSGEYRDVGGGATYASESWSLAEGNYQVDGIYERDNRFNGTVTFDDPATPQNPDWIVNNRADLDGTVTQLATTYLDHWQLNETVTLALEGSYSYSFGYDNTLTEVDPDYRGSYWFDGLGAGSGGYTQFHDDGSTLKVEQDIASDGSYDQRWWYDDASTEQPVDQEGAVHYNSDGSGSGTILTHVVGGDAETCDIEIAADGSSSIDNCR
ncbi:MAG: hypothetical protein JXR83_21355 [Deltaproteobacteria bacterium]|nr:hypothetical protein [Deltaproteobacteria bacterium]